MNYDSICDGGASILPLLMCICESFGFMFPQFFSMHFNVDAINTVGAVADISTFPRPPGSFLVVHKNDNQFYVCCVQDTCAQLEVFSNLVSNLDIVQII